MIKFLPAYIGGKQSWVKDLEQFRGRNFIEVFAGSAVLSANLAQEAWLNDADQILYTIYTRYDELIVPDIFTKKDYYQKRSDSEWWKYIYPLIKMSYAKIFRYSKNGFNVPINPEIKKYSKIVEQIKLDFDTAQSRYVQLSPTITCWDYSKVFEFILEFSVNCFFDSNTKPVIVLDPPYPKSYTSKKYGNIDYNLYYELLNNFMEKVDATYLVFSRSSDLRERGFKIDIEKSMNVHKNGITDKQGLSIIEK